jgi:hypothetical protein
MCELSYWFGTILDFTQRYNGAVTAIATIFVAAFTIVLARVTARQARLTREAVALGRDEFNATHRPRLHVRNIVVKPASKGPGGYPAPEFAPNHPVSGQFYVANIGASPARIVESHCEILWDLTGLPMTRPYEGKNGNDAVPPCTIAGGSSAVGCFQSEQLFDVEGTLGAPGGPQIYVMGWIEYADGNDIRRRTAFCRQLIRREGEKDARFHAVADPDYEHEE